MVSSKQTFTGLLKIKNKMKGNDRKKNLSSKYIK